VSEAGGSRPGDSADRGAALLRRIYRLLMRTYPRSVRISWAAEMECWFARLWVLESAQRGLAGRIRLLVAAFADVLAGGLRARWRRLPWGFGVKSSRGGTGRSLPMLTLLTDARYAARMLARQPLFTLAAVVTLALGIGANTMIFSMVHAFLLKPLPYPEPDRLVMVWAENPSRDWTRMDASPADAWDFRSRARSFEDLALVGLSSVNLTGREQPARLEAKRMSWNGLSIFGVEPGLGRDFMEADMGPGEVDVTIVSWSFWQRQLSGRADVVGSTIELDGVPHTIIGVTAETFLFPDDDVPDVYLVLREDPATMPRSNHSFNAIARLAPGVTVERANEEIQQIAASLAEEYPETNEGFTAIVVSMRTDLVGPLGRQATLVLMTAVGFVLLMACVNVANLLLARANGRRREMAVRAALGAPRWRVIRQLLTESLMLALTGGAVGVLLAIWGTRMIALSMPPNLPVVFRFDVDVPVLGFALAVSLLATLLFGLVPAVRGSATSGELRERGTAGNRRNVRFGGALVVVQTALAVVLLVGGGVLMRSVTAMHDQDRGYDVNDVLTARITPPQSKYPDEESLMRYHDAVLERVRAVPGVTGAGTIQSLPLRGSNNVNTFGVEGEASGEDGHPARMGYLSPGYLDAMRVSILRGRGITEADREGSLPIALVNATLARQRFGTADAIGRALRVNGATRTIVGVVADMRERSVAREPEPSIYMPVAQAPVRTRSLAIRTGGDPAALADAVQRAVWSVDPDQPLYELQPMTALVDVRISPFELIAGLMLAFAAISLLLGAVGIYGVTAFAVVRRTNEIGLRIAVGAERSKIVRMIVRQGMIRAAIGLAIGVPLAFAMSRALAGLLVGVSPGDPLTFGIVVALLGSVTFLGAWLPARRAARLDPVRALTAN
jgi:predicted permease